MSLFNSGYSRQTTLGENLIQGEDPSDKILEEDTIVYEYKTGPYEGQELDKVFI